MWITNGGFADLIIVFAKTDGDRLTAFIVERTFQGVSAGKEEHKMGLHGSSTTPILLDNVPVPAGNVLGEVGRGHKVALNTLNYGRFSLGAMCAGGSKLAVGESAAYACDRRQFGHPIGSFGAIKHKLGEMVARAYAAESLVYRTAGLMDAALSRTLRDGAALSSAFEEYAIESSIAKVMCSETLDFALDENVQIHGGNGYVADYGAERAYRDGRVNRIFEGTNEINRLLIPGTLIKRALKGTLPLIAAAKRLQDDILQPAVLGSAADESPLEEQRRVVNAAKRIGVMILGTAMQTFGDKLSEQQELLGYAADVLIDVYAADSATLRASAAAAAGHPDAAWHESAARVYGNDAALRIEVNARCALAAMAEGDTLRTLLAALRRLLKTTPTNTVRLRRTLADQALARRGYIVS